MFNAHRPGLGRTIGMLLGASVLAASACVFGAASQAPNTEAEEIKTAQKGLDSLMNGDPDAAVQEFLKIQSEDPDSPLGFLMEADATWWKIYLTTGNLIDPDVFDVGSSSTSSYDAHFADLVRMTITKAQTNITAKRDVARNELYQGMAYALRARFAAMRDQNLDAARAGKQMRSLLITALEKDKNLRDAYLGLSLYDYFVDTLPTIVKLFRWLLGLPGGSRTKGLQEIEYAAKYGELTSGEAKFYLAKDYSRGSERQYSKSLEFFQDLQREYPYNELWKLQIGSLEIRTGHTKEGEALYREVLDETREKQSEIEKAFHRAAKKALVRRHPGEKFE